MSPTTADPPPPEEHPPSGDALSLPPPPQRRGGIVRRSWGLIGEHWARAGLAVLLVALPLALLSAFLDRQVLDGGLGAGVGAATQTQGNPLIDLVEGIVVFPLALAAVLHLMAERVRDHAEALAAGVRRLAPVVGTVVVGGILTALPMVPALVAFLAGVVEALDGMDGISPGEMPSGMAVALLLALLGTPVSVYLGLSLALGTPLAALEARGPLSALKASWPRMKGQRLRLLGGMLATVLPLMFGMTALLIPFALLAMILGSEGGWIVAGMTDAVFTAALALAIGAVSEVVRRDTAPPEPAQPTASAPGWDPADRPGT